MKRLTAVVFAGLLAASLPLAGQTPPFAGPDFQINVVTEGFQGTPDVARDAAGNFVTVWADSHGSDSQVKVRRYSAAGAPQSGEVLVWPVVSHPEPRPRVAMTPQGAFVVVWQNESGISMRRFDRFAQPEGAAFLISPQTGTDKQNPDVVLDAAGNAVVVWDQWQSRNVFLQRLDAEDRPQGDPQQVNQSSIGPRGNARVALNAAGSLLVSWDDYRDTGAPDVYARRFDGPTGSWAPDVRVHGETGGFQEGSAPVLYPEGDGVVVYHDQSVNKVFAQRLDASGALLGQPLEVGDQTFFGPPDAAASFLGQMMVVWSGDTPDGARIYGRLIARDWVPITDKLLVSTPSPVDDVLPSIAGSAALGFAVAWSNGDADIYPGSPPNPQNGRDGSFFGVFARLLGPEACLASSTVLCLGGGRFQARVTWKNPATGETGMGRILPLTTDTGAFWFFGQDNLELVVKVLDGTAVNGAHWVYYGALSDVEYTLEVTDNRSLKTKTYRNPAGRLASRADVDAFPETGPPPPAAASKAASAPRFFEAVGSCQPSPEALCLNGSRFRVTVRFNDPRTGSALDRQAQAIPLTGDTGTFYFFNPENIELMIKILDGRPHNGRFWVYYGALSDVAYTITVEDTETGETKTYENAPGRLVSRADVEAFPIP